MHRYRLLLITFVLFMLIGFGAHAGTQRTTQILFVGNSLTYVGNLPAVFKALAMQNGKPVETAMIVKGGATLTQWHDTGAVRRALATRRYDYAILQERGNDFACGFGPKVCKDSRGSLRALARTVRARGVKPILLGTYEPDREGSEALIDAESKAARSDAMPYIEVSHRLLTGQVRSPHIDWFYKDGMHPGHELILLEAVLLYRQIFGELPDPRPLSVHALMFVPGSKFSVPSPLTLPLPGQPVADAHAYTRKSVEVAVELARGR